MVISKILALAALLFASLVVAAPAQAQSAQQTNEMTARGCVIRTDAGQRFWACPPGALNQTGSDRGAQQSAPSTPSTPRPSARNYCVRSCDGYFFPLDGMNRQGDAARQAACETACPGAQMSVYSTRPGEEIANARTINDSRRYGELENAFLHRLRRVENCSCRSENPIPAVEAARQDQTLRRGDIIVTESGMEVYQGANQFVDYREAESIGRSTREALTRRLEVSQR